VNFAMNALNDAADAVEARRRKLYGTTNDQGKRTSRRVSGPSPPSRDLSKRRVNDAPITEVLQSPPPQKAPETQSPFKTVPGSRPTKKEWKRLQKRHFRTWHDSSGSHHLEAALVDYNAGNVRLSSSTGALVEVSVDLLSQADQDYVKELNVYNKGQRKPPRRGSGDSQRSGIVGKILGLFRRR